MTKEFKKALIYSAAVMVAIPLIVSLIFSLPASSGWGMMATLFLFFVVDPTFTIGLGVFCGTDTKKYFSLPLINAVFCLAGVWAAFDFGDMGLLVYPAAYLVIGYAVMYIFSVLRRPEKWEK